MQKREFALRRRELCERLGDRSVAIISAAKKNPNSDGGNYPYRQNGDFYYLTGCVEPEAVAVLVPGRDGGEFVLFSREDDLVKKIWDGDYIDQVKACSELGADRAFAISEVDNILPQILEGRDTIYFNLGFDSGFVRRIIFWLNQAKSKVGSNGISPYKLVKLDNVLHEMRLKKEQIELVNIRKAAEITTSGHLRAMQKCKPGMYEFELAAELLYEFNRLGGRRVAFEPIVAGGVNSCTLHYSKNGSKLSSGELVLVDAGVEYEHYCADVSRTYPVNGVFTSEQRAIYEIVLSAELELIKSVRPGVEWNVLQSVAERVITAGLVDIGLLQGKVEDLLLRQESKPFFVHKFGHWLGLDVHDVGGYMVGDKWRTLESGMVFTVEPGIYIRSDIPNIDSRWFGIGVRIEDNILVTDSGHEVLTESLPKNVAEIESIMKTNH